MASGTVFADLDALSGNPPATVYATLDSKAGGSTPNAVAFAATLALTTVPATARGVTGR